MINVSGLSKQTKIGRFLRMSLSFLPKEAQVRVLQGPARGKRWIVGSGIHGFWLGSYEYQKQRVFMELIRKGNIVYDIGANVGFYTLISSAIVGDDGLVVAFEPRPRNASLLRDHIAINKLVNVKVYAVAISESDGTAQFDESRSNLVGRLSPEGSITVPVRSIDSLTQYDGLPFPDLVKIDVEGAELDVLLGAEATLDQCSPRILLATHNQDIHKKCCSFLSSKGYVLSSVLGDNIETTDELLAVRK